MQLLKNNNLKIEQKIKNNKKIQKKESNEKKTMYPNVHSSVIYNSRVLETA